MNIFLVIDIILDKIIGINTIGKYPVSTNKNDRFNEFTFSEANGTESAYYINIIFALISALRLLKYKCKDISFYDVGCGTGRPLIVASYLPFHNIIGYDISSQALTVARENLQKSRFKIKDNTRINLFLEDATQCLPINIVSSAKHSLIFMFNPFSPRLMDVFLKSIQSVDRTVCVVIINFYLENEPSEYFREYTFCGLKNRTLVGILNEK